MARLKIFTEIKPNAWDILKKVPSNGYSTGLKEGEECDIINVTREYPEKIFRTYCKCGYTSGRLEEVCPECGNKRLKIFTFNGTRQIDLQNERTLEEEYMVNAKGSYEECVSGYIQRRYVEVLPTNEFEFVETAPEKEFSICSDKVDSTITSYGGYSYEEFAKLYKYPLENFEYYKKDKGIAAIVGFIQTKDEFPVLMDNIKKYPNIVNYIINRTKGTDPFKLIKTWDEVYKLFNVPREELNPYIENLYKETNYYYYYSYREVQTEAFEEYIKLHTDLQKVADYILIHGDISYGDYKDICKRILSVPEKEADALMYFVRNNYVSLGTKVISSYLEKTKFLRDLGFEISIMNLDTRNYNLIKNKKHITETKKYNEKKTMFFLEMFDLNPLDSLQYLDTRRAPNKDLRKELSEKLD